MTTSSNAPSKPTAQAGDINSERIPLDAPTNPPKTGGRIFLESLSDPSDRLLKLVANAFDENRPPRPPKPMFKIRGTMVASPGNICLIASAEKTGKTGVINGSIASVIKPDDVTVDTLGFEAEPLGDRLLLHFDTEQSAAAHDSFGRRVLKRAGLAKCPPSFHSFHTKGNKPSDTLAAIEELLMKAEETGRGIHSIFIDGVADLVSSVNDERECQELVTRMEAWATRYDCVVFAVIHLNPKQPGMSGGQKSRGHLGSMLTRKAESVLSLTKNGEITTIKGSALQRNAPIPENAQPRFRYCPKAGMHVSCGTVEEEKVKAKEMRTRDEFTKAFGESTALSYSDLRAAIMDECGIEKRAAENRISTAGAVAIISKNPNKTYSLV